VSAEATSEGLNVVSVEAINEERNLSSEYSCKKTCRAKKFFPKKVCKKACADVTEKEDKKPCRRDCYGVELRKVRRRCRRKCPSKPLATKFPSSSPPRIAPVPVPVPAPVIAPVPVPVPAPVIAPVPVPVPAPVIAPVPVPVPAPSSFPTKFPSLSPSNECFDDTGIVEAVADYFDDRKDAEEQYGSIGSWSTCRVTDIAYLFNNEDRYYFKNEDLNGWNLSSVTSLKVTFYHAGNFNGRISDWDVSLSTSFRGCFAYTYSFNQDISGWDVASSENFEDMFFSASTFNQELSGWDVTVAKNFAAMFDSASSFNQCLEWQLDDTDDDYEMFYNSPGGVANSAAWPCA